MIGAILTVIGIVFTILAWQLPQTRPWVLARRLLRRSTGSDTSKAAVTHSETPGRKVGTINCRYCEGEGRISTGFATFKPCFKCGGKGVITTDRIGQPDCRYCKGTARISTGFATFTPCHVCDGVGLQPYD